MNLCQAYPLFIILCISIGRAIAHFTDAPMLYGISIGMAVGMTPLVLLGIMYGLMMAWRPERPMCRCGKCKSEDYAYVGPEIMTYTEKTVFEYQCPFCSRRYRQKDKRFWEVSSEDSEIPYMVVSKWGRWENESTKPPLASS